MTRPAGTVLLAVLGTLSAAPARGQQAGLLLGLAADSTVWIAARGDSVTVRRGPGLYVPRRDGFWQLRWLGATCPPRLVDLPVGAGPLGAAGLTAAPLGRPAPRPTIMHPAACHPEYNAEGDESVNDEVVLHFVGTDHVVVAYHYANEGESAPTRLYINAAVVLALDDLGRAGFALEDWSRESAAPLGPAVHDSLFTACEGLAADSGLDLSGTRVLALERAAGRWVYDARVYSDCSACFNDAVACPLPARPPREVVGFDSLTVPWSAIVRRVPRALDAFTSPRGDFAAVRDSTGLQLFRAAGGALTDRLGAVPLAPATPVVLSQWALGGSVARWDAVFGPRLGASRAVRP